MIKSLMIAAAAAGVALVATSASAQISPNWRVAPAFQSTPAWAARTDAAAYLVTNQKDGTRPDAAEVMNRGVGANFATVELDHPINDRLSGQVNRRYVGETDAHYHAVVDRFGGDYQASDVTWGFSYRFGR
jgi:hypothetical protein